ncbi:MAG: hypothetical protein Q7S37_00400 [bacterium]|nr:hypothetical protein [bacterium]
MKKTLIIVAAVIVFGGIAFASYRYWLFQSQLPPTTSGDIKLKVVTGETGKPISNAKITVCDFSIVFDVVPGEIRSYCERVKDARRENSTRVQTATDDQGIFYLNKSELLPAAIYMVEVKTISEDRSSSISFENLNADGTASLASETIIRVLNQESDGHVVSNKYYDLTTKQVREVFTDKAVAEKTYPYETVNLVLWSHE